MRSKAEIGRFQVSPVHKTGGLVKTVVETVVELRELSHREIQIWFYLLTDLDELF